MSGSLRSPLPNDAALIVIDMQKAIDHPSWGERNNPGAEQNVAALLHAWRTSKRPIYHIRHDSTEAASTYRPFQPGNDFKPEAQPLPDEIVIPKQTNSAFVHTELEARLRAAQQTMSLANVDGEYCTVVRTADVLAVCRGNTDAY